MHRCWLADTAPLQPGDPVTLAREESAHVARVLRMRAGESVGLIAADHLYEGELLTVDEAATRVRVTRQLPSPEPATHVTLVQGLPKLDKLELIVQKATELGVWDVLPVEMERSIARLDDKEARKRERWSRIALEAAKQSGRAHVPEILPALPFKRAIETLRMNPPDAVLVAWEEEHALRLSDAVTQLRARVEQPRAIALVIGPEGGISPAEIEALSALNAVCVTLGKRILRTETAGLCALAVTMSALGEL